MLNKQIFFTDIHKAELLENEVGKVKENPFTYEHEYAVQEVLSEIIGGVKFFGKNID